jgi:RNA polymerase sigma factor (sigma-70 family)
MTLTLGSSAKASDHGEAELVAAARAGDDRAFEQLYARYRQRIFAFIASRVRDHGRAEDIAQEVFISALRRLRSSDGEMIFRPWIYEIAKNACIDEYRRGSRQHEVPLETDGELITDRQSTLRAAPTPAAAIEEKQQLEDLRGAFGGLSTNHHQLLVMREFEGLSYDEIGHRLGMTRPMVESSLFRARRKLTEEYEELASGRRCEQVQGAIAGGRLRSARDLGLRDRRRVARHLAHCQACRHVALTENVDHALVQPRRISEKIAALLPFGLLRRLLEGRGGTLSGSSGSALGGRAVAAVAAVALAGAGGGAIQALTGGGTAHRTPGSARAVAAADVVPAPGVAAPLLPGALHHAIAPTPRSAARTGYGAPAGGHRAALSLRSDRRRPGPSRPPALHRSTVAGRGSSVTPSSASVGGSSHVSSAGAAPEHVLANLVGSSSAPLGSVAPVTHSLATTVDHTLSAVTGPINPGSPSSPLGALTNAGPLAPVVKTVSGLATTIAQGANSVLGAVTGSPSSSGSAAGASATDSHDTAYAGSVSSTPAAVGPVAPPGAGMLDAATAPVKRVISGVVGGR